MGNLSAGEKKSLRARSNQLKPVITIGVKGVGEGGRMKAKADTQRRIDKRTAKKKRRILPDEVRTLAKV